MRGKALMFFATGDELVNIFKEVSSKINFKLFRIDDIYNNQIEVYESIDEIEDIGISISGDQVLDKRYLLIPKNNEPKTRKVELKSGNGFTYHADQGNNPSSVLFEPGGVYKNYEAIISGQINTVSKDEWSQELYKILSKEFKKKFEKINVPYVSTNAAKKLDEGVRLTKSIDMPPLYDLQR